jgi:transposase
MFTDMKQWTEIRRRVLDEGISRRQILRETGLHWQTLKKILDHSGPPGYRQAAARPKKKLGPYVGRIEQILKEDRTMPKKQRHTAKRIFERLRQEGYEGGYTVVKEAVREMERHNREVFVPLMHPPSEAQVDSGEALARVDGVLRKVAMFVMAFEREGTETFWEGHVRALAFFGGVPRKIAYENTRVPVPQVRDLAALDAHLRERCEADQERRLRGQAGSKRQLLEEDRAAFLPLRAVPFEACRQQSTATSSISPLRFDDND